MPEFREAPDLAYRQGYEDAIRDAAQAVEALPEVKEGAIQKLANRFKSEALAAIRGLIHE